MKFESRARLSLVLLFYFLGVVCVVTLAPFRFVATPNLSNVFANGGSFDVVANVLLFLPLGFLYPLSRRAQATSVLHVFLVGLALSGLIEAMQAFEPERYSALLDVITNATGAACGALVLRVVLARIEVNATLVGRLSLEIPLIGLIYLLLPLLLVASLSAADEPVRLLSLIPLGLLCARLMAAVQRAHFGPPGVFRDRSIGLFAASWMVVGIFPVALRHPIGAIGLATAVGLVTWYDASRPAPTIRDRRFESDTLRSAVPYVAAYFVATALLPLLFDAGRWHLELGLTGPGEDPTEQMIGLLEPIASLTVLGYMIAEARGRGERPFRSIAFRLAIECGVVALVGEGSRGFQPVLGASGVQFALMVAAGLLGGAIYHKQRRHVRWILAHRPTAPVEVDPRPARRMLMLRPRGSNLAR